MRSAFPLALVLLTGCGSTVYRLEGDPITPGGVADTSCEASDWLVMAKTRAMVVDKKSGTSHPVNGYGLYRVGGSDPESIPSIEGFPPNESAERKREALAPYKRRQVIAGVLGGVGVAALAVGTALFISAFETKHTAGPNGTVLETNTVNGTKAGLGGVVVGLGFGFGIGGLVVNPSNAERTEARATRYVFIDPPDDEKSVENLTLKHNEWVRQTCAAPAR